MEQLYTVTITETLKMDVEVAAESLLQAEQIVNDSWRNSDYILDADNFVDVDFKAKPAVQESILARLEDAKKQAVTQPPKPKQTKRTEPER